MVEDEVKNHRDSQDAAGLRVFNLLRSFAAAALKFKM